MNNKSVIYVFIAIIILIFYIVINNINKYDKATELSPNKNKTTSHFYEITLDDDTDDVSNIKKENKKNNHECIMERQPQLISIDKITNWPDANIYISDLYTAQCPNIITKYNIKGVINVSPFPYEAIAPNHLVINILDEANTDLTKHFDKVHKFIDDRLNAGENILVHCHAGISRSVSMVISYLMKHNKTKYHQTWLQVKEKRKQAEPNYGFVEQLKKYEQDLKLK